MVWAFAHVVKVGTHKKPGCERFDAGPLSL
jgi:hypothetical protein